MRNPASVSVLSLTYRGDTSQRRQFVAEAEIEVHHRVVGRPGRVPTLRDNSQLGCPTLLACFWREGGTEAGFHRPGIVNHRFFGLLFCHG
jgi:hypothetical protein